MKEKVLKPFSLWCPRVQDRSTLRFCRGKEASIMKSWGRVFSNLGTLTLPVLSGVWTKIEDELPKECYLCINYELCCEL